MGKYEGEGEVSIEERSERKHKHHHHKSSHDKSSSKREDSGYHVKGDPDTPASLRKHHHRKSSSHLHHHHHTSSKDLKDEDKAKRDERRHSKVYKKGDDNDDTETSTTKLREHHAKRENSRDGFERTSPVVGSRLMPFNSDSIRGSRRNSRNFGNLDDIKSGDEKSTNTHADANGGMEEHSQVVSDSKEHSYVVEERTIVERVVTDVVTSQRVTETVVVDEVVVVLEPTTTSASTPPVERRVVIEEPITATSPTLSGGNGRTPESGNPGRIPSPIPDTLFNKRYSSIIEPPMPWESKKDKRKSKRSSKYTEHKKNILGETIYKGHPSWLLMRDIQTGLFQSIKTVTSNAIQNAINLFHTPPVQVFPIAPGSNSTFKFKDYCPGAFFKLREHFGINHQDYVASICHNWNEVGTPGKSGSLFFFSQDNQYVLKTIPKREAKLLRSLLPSYYHHMVKNDNSLLTRFMGLHRVKPHKGRQVRFLVMGNLFRGPLKIHQRFDLKGSTAGRELSAEARKKKNPTFKDMDFRRLNKKIPLGARTREAFLQQLSEDCKFLVSQNIMDYSLLVGIHFKSIEADQDSDDSSGDENDQSPMSKSTTTLPQLVADEHGPASVQLETIFEREEGGLRGRAEDGTLLDEYYYIGIIDILMLYTVRKQIEHAYKSVVSRGGEISAVKPEEYASRFLKFISDITG